MQRETIWSRSTKIFATRLLGKVCHDSFLVCGFHEFVLTVLPPPPSIVDIDKKTRSAIDARHTVYVCECRMDRRCATKCGRCDGHFLLHNNLLESRKSPLHGQGSFATAQIRKNAYVTVLQEARKDKPINHSCFPNARFVQYPAQDGSTRLAVRSLRDVGIGEEITVDYGDFFYLFRLDMKEMPPRIGYLYDACIENCRCPICSRYAGACSDPLL